jgi:isochorismate synthase EntC
VVDDLRARLDGFVTSLEAPATPTLKRLPTLAHLHTPIVATLRDGVSALEVARALHPTPAVAGAPRRAALDWLSTNEGLERGWYCGAFGAMGGAGLCLAVGLRCAVVRETSATVYVGAGVVKGSTPAGEWEETERKAKTMLSALGVES